MKYLPIFLAALLAFASCGRQGNSNAEAREQYARALTDSIADLQAQIDSCNNVIDVLREDVLHRMSHFTTVSNPREVAPYMIMTDYADKAAPAATGLIARIDESNRFELLASLAGKHFDQIAVKSPSNVATSDTVPNDQALNYRSASLTTVLFSGEAAERIGQLIADNELNPLQVIYMQGSPVQSWHLPADNAKMIAQTYLLYKSMSELARLERRVPMLHAKINILRQHLH